MKVYNVEFVFDEIEGYGQGQIMSSKNSKLVGF